MNDPYPIFRRENITSYIKIVLVWLLITAISAWTLKFLIVNDSLIMFFIWAGINVMAGMCIMFIASLLNLKKLSPGFKKLAEGSDNPDIPPVWCPVLTAATNAALELSSKVKKEQEESLVKEFKI